MGQRINDEFIELSKTRDVSRDELNKNIADINGKHNKLKKRFDDNMRNISKQIDAMQSKQDKQTSNANEEEGQYKILYETSMKKINMLNDEMTDCKQDNHAKQEQIIKLKKERENWMSECEAKHKNEMDAMSNKYKLEINELGIKLKCTLDEYNEFKTTTNEKIKIEGNNKDLLIENLKRENEALCNELSGYRQTATTMSPNSALLSPAIQKTQNYENYSKHIQDSPLNERTQNELLSISKTKDLETTIKNLNEECDSYKHQLFAKKELIKEFEGMLGQNQFQQKQILTDHQNYTKIINLYRILTGTKIERQLDENNETASGQQYLCRTAHKEMDSMLEYYLSLDYKESSGENAQSFCDYHLISSHNLIKPLNESLSQNITFYTKDAPLFLKGLIQQMFITKT